MSLGEWSLGARGRSKEPLVRAILDGLVGKGQNLLGGVPGGADFVDGDGEHTEIGGPRVARDGF